MTSPTNAVAVGTAAELARAGTQVVEANGVQVLLLWNNGDPVAMNDTCIHRGRSLSDGVVFAGRLVCAGHQWAFDLHTGYCRAREKYQPVYALTIEDGTVYVDVSPASGSAEEPVRDTELAQER
ncbi:MAG TPA: Rieske 2Fe-2S domain-containing protein [Jatrophihabitans sp.]|nr:Rieske 2Fe-2S domain-containing protein [Jatrophihabitans sp.]